MPEKGAKKTPFWAKVLILVLFFCWILVHIKGVTLILYSTHVLLGIAIWIASFVLYAAFLVAFLVFGPGLNRRNDN
jgi:hypothetical protein